VIFTQWPWQHWARRRGGEAALILDDQTLTWRQLCRKVDALASGLRQQGVNEGACVALRGRNGAGMAGANAVRRTGITG